MTEKKPIKKDYDGPLYAPWSKVVAGKKAFQDKYKNVAK
mgnify:CR=1 FL=1